MATTTTQKAKNFQGTPLKELELKDVPGVGEKSLLKLQDANIDTSIGLMGQFFLLKMEEQLQVRSHLPFPSSHSLMERSVEPVAMRACPVNLRHD